MRLLKVLAAAAWALAASTSATAQAYPTKPIRIIVAYQAGQGTDIATRYLADQMSKDLGQAIIIDNRPGAGGNLGTELAAQAAPDGYTLTMGTNATHGVNPYLYANTRVDPERDFEPIMLVGTFPMVLAVNAGAKLNSVSELVAATQRDARSADIALPSTTARLVVELLKERSSVAFFGVPYKGSGNAMTDVLGGQLPVIVDTPTALRPHLGGGKVRAIAVTSLNASGLVPGVKTLAEQGFPGFEVVAWNALYAPRGTPQAVIATLNGSLAKILARPETRHKLLEFGFDPAGGTPAHLADFARQERRKWEPLIKAAGIRAD
ncbi:MAG TPA: tripartite tricarboxylate transporter substrate binding protein [Ramlibacter sp.]|nr:tripartite tricarboxylate transporter substrate binding protein [Ramlibacter sp.]